MSTQEMKKNISRLGIGYFVFLALAELSGIGIQLLLKNVAPGWRDNSWLVYIVSILPLWAIGFTTCYLIVRNLPKKTPDDHEMKPKYVASFYLMLIFMMIGGNIIGIVIGGILKLITGVQFNNSTIELIQGQQIIPSFVFAVILAPICEELAFRKVLIDRVGMYNKKYTIVLSGLLFGLFHANLFQFFYAFAIGVVFAYIYTITGRIRYSIILHMIVNFMHGVLPMVFLKHLDLSSLQSISSGGNPMDPEFQKQVLAIYTDPYFLMYMGYVMLLFILLIVGFILFCLNVKKMKVDDSTSPLQKPEAAKTIYLNVGMMLFIIGCIADTIWTLIMTAG